MTYYSESDIYKKQTTDKPIRCRKRSVQELESEKHKLDQELQAMEEKQKALETRLQNPAGGVLAADGRPLHA